MVQFRFTVFLAALCSCALLGRAEVEKPETKLLDVLPKITSEPSVPTQQTDITPTDVTGSDMPLSHPKPDDKNTTTSTTSTTTSTTSTTTTTTTTSTPAPPPPPPPKPTPLPQPDQGTWSYTDAQNVTCIMVQFAARLDVSYSKTVNNSTVLASASLNVPANASVLGGSCNGTEQWISLSWAGADNNTVNNTMRLQFLRNDTTKNYALKTMLVTIDAKTLVNSSSSAPVIELTGGEEWQTPLATSYRCSAPTQLRLSTDKNNIAANLTLSELQEEAFRTGSSKGFSAPRWCGGGDVPDSVPIAVGCALAALVIVVLIGYVVARRRAATQGYLSM